MREAKSGSTCRSAAVRTDGAWSLRVGMTVFGEELRMAG